MPFVSITRLRLRSWVYLAPFLIQGLRIGRQAAKADGSLGVKLIWERRNTFWTATSWSEDTLMRQFMRDTPHGPAMRKLPHWCDEASVVHWTQAEAELPSWEVAHQRMRQEGRPSKVNYPSADHTARTIPEPVTRGARELRFK